MTASGGTAFTTTMWMIDRVHDYATHRWPDTTPATRTGLAKFAQAVLIIANFADDCATFHADLAHLTRPQPQSGVATITGNELGGGARGARHLGTLARTHLNAMHLGAQGTLRSGKQFPAEIGASSLATTTAPAFKPLGAMI